MRGLDWNSLPADRRRPMKAAVLAQCFGMFTQQLLSGGVLLLYLNAMHVGSALILVLLNLIPFISSGLSIPLGWGADRFGVKIFGSIGNGLIILGIVLIAAAGSLLPVAPQLVLPVIIVGLAIHTIGASLFNTGWFSLLSHIVPPELTGRYFGILRSSWQLLALIFYAITALFFSERMPPSVYQILLIIGGISVACRAIIYRELPDVETNRNEQKGFVKAITATTSIKGFLPYVGYLFLLVFVTGNGQDMLRLSAVKGYGLGDNQILLFTVSSMLGSLIGFQTMGTVVDAKGPRFTMKLCHLGYAAALFILPGGTWIHLSPFISGIAASLLLGFTTSTLGLSTTAQSFMICRGSGRTIAYALISSIQSFGSGLSGFALAALIHHLTNGGNSNPFNLVMICLSIFVVLLLAVLHRLKRELVSEES